MGQAWDDDHEHPNAAWAALLGHSERYADLGLGAHGVKLRNSGPLPPSLATAPMIIDTDIGGDPDDALALAVAARAVPHLALVLTCDEHRDERARFARHLLQLLGRGDVPVVAGKQLIDRTPYFSVGGLVPNSTPAPPENVVDAAVAVITATAGPVRWVGMGPLSNLHAVLAAHPDLTHRIAVTQMGGALRYRDPAKAEHNFRLDPQAAAGVLRSVTRPRLVISDTTFTSTLELTADSAIYERLEASALPWAKLLREHMDNWFARFFPGTIQHDGLTLSAAMELPFVDFDPQGVALDAVGRMRLDDDGAVSLLSGAADHDRFMRWLARLLRVSQQSLVGPRT